MNEVDIAIAREKIGASLSSWVASPDMTYALRKGSWFFFSGIPSPAVNMAMVSDDEGALLDDILNSISENRVPAVLFLASEGKNLSGRLPTEWRKLGLFTFMAKDLSNKFTELDKRVSLASADDAESVLQLLEEAFTVESGTYQFLFGTSQDPRSALNIWVLKVDGVVVSTVTTILVGDALSIWCMATPQRFERRGYGKALLGHVVARSKANGAKIGLLSATPAGKPLYFDSGWESLEEWDVYLTAAE